MSKGIKDLGLLTGLISFLLYVIGSVNIFIIDDYLLISIYLFFLGFSLMVLTGIILIYNKLSISREPLSFGSKANQFPKPPLPKKKKLDDFNKEYENIGR